MLLALILAVHMLLLLIYAIAIEKKKSRHEYVMLFFALLFPIVGEICLFVTEFGKTDSKFDLNKLFKYRDYKKCEKNGTIVTDLNIMNRESLLQVIEDRPDNIVELLKTGLSSQDSEIVHLSASAIMKMQRDYEIRVSQSETEYNGFPENMALLKAWIKSLMDYYETKLLKKELGKDLLIKAEELLNRLLTVTPHDIESITMLVKVIYAQGNVNGALELCDKNRRVYSDYPLWKTQMEMLIEEGRVTERQQLMSQSKLVLGNWKNQEIREWLQYERNLPNAQ